MTKIVNLSRRSMLKGTAVATGGLVLGVALPALDLLGNPAAASGGVPGVGRLNGFVQIGLDGTVTITLTHAEMGQGVHTALPMIVAEELDVDWASVRVVQAPSSPDDGMEPAALGTGGSRSVRGDFEALSRAGAAARDMLRQAAANRWNLALDQCTARNGVVYGIEGLQAPYGDLVRGAAFLSPPDNPPLKTKAAYRLIGKSVNRLDSPEKVTGQAVFGVDVNLPNMLVGTVQHCPVWGGTLANVDPAPAMAVKGVKKVIAQDNSIIVVGDGYWPAKKGLDALSPDWNGGRGAANNDAKIKASMDAALKKRGAIAVDRGRVDNAMRHVTQTVNATYQVPFLHQAPLEPMNATAWVHDGKIEVWAPIQSAGRIRHSIAEEFGVDDANVNVHVTYMGGAFGRRIGMSFIRPAVIAAQEMGVPVKVIWSREEDMAQPMLRPRAAARFRAGLNQVGQPVAWDNRLVVPSIAAQLVPGRVRDGVDQISIHGADVLAYTIPHQRLDYAMPDAGAPLGFWRAVPHTYNGFFVESFMDEIAAAGGQDPVALRQGLLAENPRALAVLNRLAIDSGWVQGQEGRDGRFQGVALWDSFGSICGQVVELTVAGDKEIKLERIYAVVDCGLAVNPRTITAQIEGSIAYALTAAFYGRIDVVGGATAQHNFDTYEMLTLAQMPPVSVTILENGPIGGIGEPGVPPTAPALTNAIYAATGERVRSLPLKDLGYSLL